MAEDRESSDRKHEKSKKRDRSTKVDPKIWTEEEKLQLAEAIDMYGVEDLKRISLHVPTKKPNYVQHKISQLRQEHRKEIDCKDTQQLSFVDFNSINELFVSGNSKPKEVMIKWMEYLTTFYNDDPYQYNKFKLFSNAFLIMSECTPPTKTPMTIANVDGTGDIGDIDLKKVYYYLYRVFNNYYIAKHHKDNNMKLYLHNMFLRVLEEIQYNSEEEKMAMFNIVSNWTDVRKIKNFKVYGKTTAKIEPGFQEDIKPNFKEAKFKVMERPMIPSFNPFHLKSTSFT